MKVVIVGAGNTATILGRKMLESGINILQVISRNEEHASLLAKTLQAGYSNDPGKISAAMELCIIAVTDQNIPEVVNHLPNKTNAIIVHTAGSVKMDLLKTGSNHIGILYPLQTLNRQVPQLPDVPVLIDGNTEWVKGRLYEFALKWASQVAFGNDEMRMATHVSGVFVNNFTNHLIALAEDFCDREGLNFSMLLPLIRQTINRVGTMPASSLQTGPAARNDIATIEKHLSLLNKQPLLRNLYLKITESIINMNKMNAIT